MNKEEIIEAINDLSDEDICEIHEFTEALLDTIELDKNR